MLFVSKYCFSKRQLQSGCSKLFINLVVGTQCRNLTNMGTCRHYILTGCERNSYISRALSTKTVMKPFQMDFPAESKDTISKLRPNIIKDLTEIEMYSDIPEAAKRFSDCLEYNLGTGTCVMGLNALTCYKKLEKPENLTEDNVKLATILAWCVEVIGTSIILADDIMDNSETRRNAPCWFRIENIGLSSVNDVLFLENCCYLLLKKYFSSHPMYIPMMECFLEAMMRTVQGQCLDCTKPKIEEITLDRYIKTTVQKGYLFFFTPTILGMYLTGTYTVELHRKIEPFLRELSVILQIQNDMWDCFGDEKSTGKIGTDIKEGKCSWPAVIALQKANPMQRKLMEEHYGRPEKNSVEIICNLYEELNLPGEFDICKENSFRKIFSLIKNVKGNDRMVDLLSAQAEMLYNQRYE